MKRFIPAAIGGILARRKQFAREIGGRENGGRTAGSCLRRWPRGNEAFIDASLRLTNCSLSLFVNEVGEQVKKTLTSVLMVPAGEVALVAPRECGGDVPATCVWVRLLPNPLVARFVMMQMTGFAGNATEVFQETTKTPWKEMKLEVSEMTLREQPDSIVVAMVVVVCFLSLIIVCLLVIIGKLMKGRRNLNRKKLIQLRGQERLLSEVNCRVCWFMRALMVEYHYLQTLPPIAYKPSHNSILSPRTTTMEVYDLTGTREMVSMEKANEIAKVIEENAATLRNVIFRTKTYSPEVAAVIAGTSLLSPLSLSCPCKGHAPRVVGPL